MPDYTMKDITPEQSVVIHFKTREDIALFCRSTGLRITPQTKSAWFPKIEIRSNGRIIRMETASNIPKYPIFVISKGRWDSRLTSKSLESAGIPYHIVVEPQEYDAYASVIDPRKILVTPFSNLGQGSIPVRNFVWDIAKESGARRHWVLDDNIDGFVRQNNNQRLRDESANGFSAIEDFVDRYTNIALAGMNYRFLGGGAASDRIPPFLLNTRIYSCILIDNAITHRWRGRYNEDTDLSIRVLKDGLCTVLFNAFKCNKIATMTMKGGNTDELYQDDGRKLMAESLRDQHPDIVQITRKWNRWQHHVDYSGFKKNKLILDPKYQPAEGVNDYGMKLAVFD